MLWLELARARFARGANEDARAALQELGATAKGGWLGRALQALLPPDATGSGPEGDGASSDADTSEVAASGDSRAQRALDELAVRPQPPDVARGLVLMAAMRAPRAGDIEGARSRLRMLATQRADDVPRRHLPHRARALPRRARRGRHSRRAHCGRDRGCRARRRASDRSGPHPMAARRSQRGDSGARSGGRRGT